jgi:hypothetical protein
VTADPTGRVEVPTDGGTDSAAVRRATTAPASRAVGPVGPGGPADIAFGVDAAVARRGDTDATARVGTSVPRAEPGATDAAAVRRTASGAAVRGHGPIGSDRPSPTAPTSTIRASDAAQQRAVATATIRRAVSTSATSTPTPQRLTTRSVLAPGTGTLADVVRRITATPSAATATPVASAGAEAVGPADGSEAVPGVSSVPSTPAEVVADRFMTALSATVQRRPAPLPTPFRPMADAIAGRRPVMLSTDAASRRALRSVRKVAATTGDTIHLDPDAVPRSRLDEVVAHELTHIAHPSPAPRFFDDIDDSPEERRAEQVARVMARSPLAPSATTSAPPARRRRDDATIRRSPAAPRTATSQGASSGTVSAQALAASLTGTSSSGTSDVVQRWDRASSSPSARSSSSSTSSSSRPQIGSHRSASNEPPDTKSDASSGRSSNGSSGGASAPFSNEREAAEWFDKRLAANVGPLLRMIEDRMRIELERRGGRNWRRS